MYSLQKESKSVKKELKNIHIEGEVDGVTVMVTAEQDVVSISVNEQVWNDLKGQEFGKKKLEDATVKALNKALKKAHKMRKNGSTLQEIGDVLGVTREAVRQMLSRAVDK